MRYVRTAAIRWAAMGLGISAMACSGDVSTNPETSGTSSATGSSGSGSGSAGSSGAGSGGESSSSSGTGDAGQGGSGQGRFPDALKDSVWLIGWAGGLDHFSWVRYAFQTPAQGTFSLLDPEGVPFVGFFPCEGGPGQFSANPSTGELVMQLPMACDQGGMTQSVTLVWKAFSVPMGFPTKATLEATIDASMQSISGYQYPVTFCDTAFTTCANPFRP